VSRLKSMVLDHCPCWVGGYRKLKELWLHRRLGSGYLPAVFTRIHDENAWGSRESLSGTGSTLAATAGIRRVLPGLLADLQVRSVLDIPCGDFHWMSQVDLDGIQYLGADVVESLIEGNRRSHAAPQREFAVLDLTCDVLPRADLVLCRDCLIHFSHSFALSALENIRRSGSRYLLTTSHPATRRNQDIITGQVFPLNLELPPFRLPKPLRYIPDEPEEGMGTPSERSLGLWRL